MQANQIRRIALGISVQGSDGQRFGKTAGEKNGKLAVKVGWWIFSDTYYVPAEEVTHATDDLVRLSVTQSTLSNNERYLEA